jgi:hypothetical protein
MADITPDEGGADLTASIDTPTPEPIPVEKQWDAPWPDPALDPPDKPAWEIEIETFWANVFANVSNKVETPIHNYLLTETEALKARLKALF